MGTVNANQPKDLEQIVDQLQVAAVNLKDAGRTAELEAGTFYAKLLQTFTPTTLAWYHHWRYDQQRQENVISRLDWVSLESEFMVMSTEAVNSLSSKAGTSRGRSQPPPWTRTTKPAEGSVRPRIFYSASITTAGCASRMRHHPIWKCSAFRAVNVAGSTNITTCYTMTVLLTHSSQPGVRPGWEMFKRGWEESAGYCLI